jgi:glycosyltransferase involved in cell wall biosynthesis
MTSPEPRVAIVAPALDILGGQGVQARSLVDALARDGHPISFVAINPAFPRGLRWLRRLPYLRTAANQALYLPGLARLAACDVAHVFSASYASFLLAPLPAMAVARALGKRVILNYHSGEADDHLTRWGALVHPWLTLADEIVVPSRYLARVFARHGYRARVIPNIVDLSRFVYHERRSAGLRLLSARNLEPYYRVNVVLEAFARIKAARPDATLTVAGYGSEEGRLRRQAVEGVRFIGRIEPEAMPRVYADADIFVNASVVDNQPLSILEAFAAGVPVVTTPAGDIPDMVRHGRAGVLVPPDDPIALAEAVLALGADAGRARDLAAAALATLESHTWTAVRDAWQAVYRTSRTEPGPAHAAVGDGRGSWTIPHHIR